MCVGVGYSRPLIAKIKRAMQKKKKKKESSLASIEHLGVINNFKKYDFNIIQENKSKDSS